ncbi:MAG: Nif3-like dinuclear metal center hexameric protein [Trueperaceae bacterium]|nr:Nif3-like dinuclear metal center hexameric protein [Trueperaceae bacterium]
MILTFHSVTDSSLNGLQVEGNPKVNKIAFAVDSSMTTFEQAADVGADMLIVHHGLFWGSPLAIRQRNEAVWFLLKTDQP